MLRLTCKIGEKIVIAGYITVEVVDSNGRGAKLGVERTREISVHREKIQQLVDEREARRGEDRDMWDGRDEGLLP